MLHLAQRFRTRLITMSPKVKIEEAIHVEFEEGRALDIARDIVARIIEKTLAHIDAKREALGLVKYDPQRFAKSEVTWDAVMGYAPAESIR